MNPADLIHAAERLGAKLFLGPDGPVFKPPDFSKMTKEQIEALRQLRLVLSRNRDSLIIHLGGKPEDYQWLPPEGTEERVWYDHIVSCANEKDGGVSTGQSGKEWDHNKDGKRLLTGCRNTVEWKKEARCFWWDTTHAAKSWKANDYQWTLFSE